MPSLIYRIGLLIGLLTGCQQSAPPVTDASPAPAATPSGGEPAATNAPPPALPYLLFEPSDLTSDTGTTVPRAVLSPGGSTDGRRAAIAALESSLRVVLWPELTAVTSKTVVRGAVGDDVATGGRALFELTPSDALENRWYAILLPSVPTGVRLPAVVPGADYYPLQSGAIVARFKPGPDAIVRRVVICKPPGKDPSVSVQFSQKLTGLPTLSSGGVACDGAPSPEFYEVVYRCSGALAGVTSLTLAGSFQAASDKSVSGKATTLTVDFAKLPTMDSCWHVRPE